MCAFKGKVKQAKHRAEVRVSQMWRASRSPPPSDLTQVCSGGRPPAFVLRSQVKMWKGFSVCHLIRPHTHWPAGKTAWTKTNMLVLLVTSTCCVLVLVFPAGWKHLNSFAWHTWRGEHVLQDTEVEVLVWIHSAVFAAGSKNLAIKKLFLNHKKFWRRLN